MFQISPGPGFAQGGEHEAVEVTNADVKKAAKITAMVAADFEMDERPPPDEELQRQLVEQYGYREIASHRWPRARRGLYLSVTLPNDRSCIEITIRDVDNANETDFTRRLKEELEVRLAEQFPSHEIRFSQSTRDSTFAP